MNMMRKLAMGGIGAGLVAALLWALWPQPMPVDLASVTLGPMQGVITAQGVTRVRNPYAITAPITGAATRFPVEVGDQVVVGETVVAVIQPADPALMDARTRAQAEAAAAEAAVAVAQSNCVRLKLGGTIPSWSLSVAASLPSAASLPVACSKISKPPICQRSKGWMRRAFSLT
ncbi:MAG: hypothetical protein ACU0BH_03575 [Paracoccaceae bacterium]